MEGANTNKFYMVFVYNNGKGVFRALGGYGGLAQSPRLFDVMTTRNEASAVAAATKKLKAKERKGYFTYKAESNFNKMAHKISMQYQDKGKSKEEADDIGRRTAYKIGAKKYGKRGMTRKAMAGRKSAEDDYGFSGLVGAYAEYLEERCGNHWQAFKEEYYENMDAEDIPVWNDGIVEWETSGPMSPTGSGYSSASAPPTGVIAGPGDTFLNYTEAQNYLVETSGGLWGAENFEAMARIDPKNAQDVANVKKALKQRYKGIKINRVEYITNRRGSSNKYHVFAFTNRGVFNGYGRIGKTMTIYGPMSETQGQKKMDTKMRRGGYKEQV
tara:strand:- start:269 stop:1252 length:984 start_codon:yes stop_codon:yes gene_type:complete